MTDLEDRRDIDGILDSGTEGDGAPRRAATDPRGKRPMRKWLVVLVGLLVLMLAGVGYYVVQAVIALSRIPRDESLTPNYTGRPIDPGDQAGQPLNLLLMGSDSRGNDRGRSDTLIVAHISGDRRKVYLISFPRDMYVDIPGHGKNKINAAYAFGGVPLSVQTVESLLGVRMSHQVLTDFEGFIGLTDKIGGVTIFNDTATVSNGFNFPRGEITISGAEALAYVRERHQLSGGDLDRAARQRTVVRAIIAKLMKPSVMANPVTFAEVAGDIGGYFTVDGDFTVPTMFSLATQMKLGGSQDIISMQAPISGFGTTKAGASIDVVNFTQLAEMADAMQNDRMADYFTKYKDQNFQPGR